MDTYVKRCTPKLICVVTLLGCGFYLSYSAYGDEKSVWSRAESVLKGFAPYAGYLKDISEEEPEQPVVNDTGEKSNENLLAELKEEPYDFGFNEPGLMLIKRGEGALKELISEFEKTDSEEDDYYLCSLVFILGQIPSEERDNAFIRKLKARLNQTEGFLRDTYTPAMIQFLAQNGCKDAISIISEYAVHDGFSPRITIAAKIALACLGKPVSLGDVSGKREVVTNLKSDAEQSWAKEALGFLDILLAYDALYVASKSKEGKFVVNVFGQGEKTSVVKGRLPDDKGDWSIEFGQQKDGMIPFYYTWHEGPLKAGGWVGVLEKRDVWHLIRYDELWIS